MKKILSSVLLLTCLTGNAMAVTNKDAVTPSIQGDATTSSFIMTIGLQNLDKYVAFQMDVTLPEGISAGDTDANITMYNRLQEVDATKSLDNSTQFVVSKNLIDKETNTYRIVGYNLANDSIRASKNKYNDGMFRVSLSAAEPTATKDIVASISNAIFVKASDLSGVPLVPETASQAIKVGISGDANDDGTVDVEDAVQVINCYTNNPLCETFNGRQADISDDSKIDAEDFVKIINKYANQ